MADLITPGNGSEPADYRAGSLDIDDNQSVSSYASLSQSEQYPLENLEVHDPNAVRHSSQILHPLGNSFKFSRRRAMVVSLIITLIVVILTAASMFFLVRYGAKSEDASKLPKQQDVTLRDAQDSIIPSELNGAEKSLLVNGDIVTRGSIKISDGTNVTTLRVQGGNGNQTLNLPTGSGTICLDSNNCGYASTSDLEALQGQVSGLEGDVSELREQLGTLSDPLSGLGDGFVKSSGGALSTVASVNLASSDISGVLAVANGGTGVSTIPANALLLGNGTGALTSVSSGGAGLCLVSTAGAPIFDTCPGGGGGAFTLAATSGTSQTINGGETLLIAAGNNVTTTASGPDTVTVATVNNPTFSTSVSTPLLQSSGALSITPNGALTVGSTGQTALLQGSTTTITSSAGNDIVLSRGAGGQIRLTGLDCTAFSNSGKLTTDASGNISCANDNGGSGSAITGTGNGNRLALFTGAQTIADSWLLQNGSTLEIDNTRNLSLMGGNLSVVGTGLFSGLVTANGGLTIEAGDTFTFNGDAFTDLTGTGLQINSGSLQTTLGTSVDLASAEVTGILPVANGGTGVNGSTAANGQLLVGNGTGYTLATITAGTGISITNGSGSISVASTLGLAIDSTEITDLTITNADIANNTINVATKTTGNFVATIAGGTQINVTNSGVNNAAVTLGLMADSIDDGQLAFNTGQHLTTSSTPSFAGLSVTGGTFTVGTTSQLASLVLHDGNGQTTTLQPGNSTGNLSFTLPNADGTLNQCIKTNASGALSFGDCLANLGGAGGISGSGTQNRLSKFGAGGTSISDSTITDNGTNVTTTVSMIVQGGGLTLGTNLQNAALTLYGNGFTANIDTSAINANNTYSLPAGIGGEFCIKTLNNCAGSGGGNAPTTAQYLTLAVDGGLSAERTLSFNGTNFSVVDNGANNSYTVNTAQNINSTATPTFSGLTLNGTLGVSGLATLNGGLTVEAGDTFTFNGEAITDLTGNGLQVTSNALTLVIQANKGLEVDSNGLSLIDCTNGQILKYNGSNQWACAADAGGSGVGDNVSVNGTGANDANFVNTAATGTTASTTFTLNVGSPDQVALTVGVASASEAGVVTTGAQTFAGAKTFNGTVTAAGGLTLSSGQSLTAAGDAIQDFTGNGLQVTSNVLSVMLDTGSGLSSSASGVSMLRTCNSGEILKWNGSAWACSTDAGAGGTGDDISVNSSSATNANFLNTTATAAVAGTTWSLNTGSNPDDITIAVSDASATVSGVVTANAQTFGGAKTFNGQITAGAGISVSASQSVTIAGDVIQDFTGNGLQVTSNALTLVTQANKGLEVDSNGLSLIDCTNGQILKYNGSNQWACAADAGGSGVGDDIQVNGTGVSSTGNIVNTSATNSIASTTWTLTPGSPDQISLAIGVASGTDAGIVTATGSQTFGGAKTFNGNLTLASSSSFATNKGTDYSTTGSQNNVAISTASLFRLTGATAQTINGIVAGRDGQTLTLINAGSNAATLTHLAGGQTAGNQIHTGTGGNVSLPVGSSISLVYDITAAVWRVIGDASDSGCSTCAATDLNNISGTNLGAALNRTSGNLALQTTTSGDITLTTAVNTGLVNVLTGSLKVGNGTPDVALNGEDAYVEGTLEVDGAVRIDGALAVNAGLTIAASQSLTIASDVIQDFTGNGLQVTGNALTLAVQSSKGVEVDSNGLSLIDCTTNQILKYNGSNQWACAADAGGSGLGDDVYVNGAALTNVNFIDTAANATNPSISWGYSSVNPDTITLALGAATATDGGIVTANSQTFGGAKTFNGNLTIANTASFATNKGTDYATTGSQNNVAISTASLYRLTGATTQTINGIVAGRDGQTLTLINAGSAAAVLTHLAGGQTAGNQIHTGTGGNVSLPVGSSISLVYDITGAVWRVIGDASDSGCSTCASTDLNNISGTNLGAALNRTSGNLQLQTTTSGDITMTTATGAGLVNVLTGNLKVGNGAPDVTLNGEDAYVEGTFEVDGTARFDGALTVNAASTFNNTVALNDNVTLATGKMLTMAGGTTASRSGLTPSEGSIYYDTDTKRLMTYSNGKWQADRRDAIYVASSTTSSQADIDAADYLADGNTGAALDGDQVQINQALTAAAGKKVVILAGTYTVDGSVSIPNSTTLAGVGTGTVITIPNALNTNFSAIVNTDTTTGTGVAVEDLRLEGNKSQQATAVGMAGIDFNNMGGSSGTTARAGAKIRNVQSNSWYGGAASGCQVGAGICIRNSNNNTISDTTTNNNTLAGVLVSAGSHNTLTGNTAQGSEFVGIYLSNSTFNTLTGNTAQGNTTNGIFMSSSSQNTITGNTVNASGNNGISLSSSNNNTISGNTSSDNGGATSNGGILLSTSDGNTITGNTVTDTSCTTTCNALVVNNNTSDNNYFANNGLNGGNILDDGTGTILSNNVLAGGTISGTDATRVLAGQANNSGNYQLQPSGTVELMKTTNITGSLTATVNADFEGSLNVGTANAFAVNTSGVVTAGTWNGSTVGVQYGGTGAATFTQYGILFGNGTSAFGVTSAGTTGQCLLSGNGAGAPTWGTCTVSSLQSVYNATTAADVDSTGTNAAEILLATSKSLRFIAADVATDPSILMKLNCTACGTGLSGNFLVQNNVSDALFSVAGNGTITIGGGNGAGTYGWISMGGSGGKTTGSFTLNGTARNTKKITLTPEYAGAVLDAASDTGGANCATNNNGTMTSGYSGDASPQQSYYQWVAGVASNQCYDVIVQVPIPSDFDGWTSTNPSMYVSNVAGTTSTVCMQVFKSTNTTDTGYSSYQCAPAMSSTLTARNFTALQTGTGVYTVGGYMTVKIRMTSASTTDFTRIGNLTFEYYSKF